jgi:hypothetical protein
MEPPGLGDPPSLAPVLPLVRAELQPRLAHPRREAQQSRVAHRRRGDARTAGESDKGSEVGCSTGVAARGEGSVD